MTDQDYSNLSIDNNGRLVIKQANSVTYKEVTGVRPSFDISKEELFNEFLELITNKNFDDALIFTFKY